MNVKILFNSFVLHQNIIPKAVGIKISCKKNIDSKYIERHFRSICTQAKKTFVRDWTLVFAVALQIVVRCVLFASIILEIF